MPLCVRRLLTGFLVIMGMVPAVSGQSVARTIAASSGKGMCSALTPADFTKTGVPVSALAQANLDGNESAYCVYSSKAGKVEFDIFFPAGATAAEINSTERTVLGEGGSRYQRAQVAGADNAQISLALPDLPGSAGIVVRKGKAVFDIVVPRGANARQQLLMLAQLVLSRLKQ